MQTLPSARSETRRACRRPGVMTVTRGAATRVSDASLRKARSARRCELSSERVRMRDCGRSASARQRRAARPSRTTLRCAPGARHRARAPTRASRGPTPRCASARQPSSRPARRPVLVRRQAPPAGRHLRRQCRPGQERARQHSERCDAAGRWRSHVSVSNSVKTIWQLQRSLHRSNVRLKFV